MTDETDNTPQPDAGTEAPITLTAAIRRSAIGLGIFAVFTAGIIAVTQTLTADRIDANQRAFEARSLYDLTPERLRDNDLLETAFPVNLPTLTDTNLLRLNREATWYQARRDGTVTAVILPFVAPEGYTEPIRLIAAIDASGTLLGVRVITHKETPGLGDQIETGKSDWIFSFDGQSFETLEPDQWQVKKDGGAFDQMTGATITPRAIVRAAARTLTFFETNRAVLLSTNPDTTGVDS
ncbi:electron transport complex subunit RsxG [Saccharospirillum impatiens]|uniref:electron transport complex subunit RsxG n=1 Tax=Saccharospirillum impatiens TaxID=169438 RepID=UPI0004269750|nr:electron transport complex subunit RsxG [Saccharospirillum impatiens]